MSYLKCFPVFIAAALAASVVYKLLGLPFLIHFCQICTQLPGPVPLILMAALITPLALLILWRFKVPYFLPTALLGSILALVTTTTPVFLDNRLLTDLVDILLFVLSFVAIGTIFYCGKFQSRMAPFR